MSKVFLITHPDVIVDPKQPIDEWILSTNGLLRAHNLMEHSLWVDVDVVYSSLELKASTVAQLAAKRFNLPIYTKECLGEIDRSSTGFMPYDEFMLSVKEFFSKPTESCRGWEKAFDATKRISDCVNAIISLNSGKNIVLIGHGAIFAILLCYIKNIPPTFELCQDGVG